MIRYFMENLIFINFAWCSTIGLTFTARLDIQGYGTLDGYNLAYVSVKPNLNHILTLQPMHSTTTANITECGVECLKHTSPKCLSFNIEQVQPDEHNCVLFDAATGDFNEEPSKHHFTIEEVCWENPCPPNIGFSCLPRDFGGTLDCKCKEGYTGEPCNIERLSKQQGTVSLSTTHYIFYPSNSVDDNYNQGIGSCAHTALNSNEWWQFTFNFDVKLHSVVIFLRNDCCLDRTDKAEVQVYDASQSNFQICGSIGIEQGFIPRVKCESMLSGRGVRIIQPHANNGVAVCEVDMYGYKLP